MPSPRRLKVGELRCLCLGFIAMLCAPGCDADQDHPDSREGQPGTTFCSGPDIPASLPSIEVLPSWAEVVQQDPPESTAADYRAAVRGTRLPWCVRDRATKIELILIPAATYVRGSEDPLADPEEKPRHRVVISKPFYCGKFEVTEPAVSHLETSA